MLQNATPLRKSAPGPPNSSDEHVSCTAPATENASLQILFKCPTPAIVFCKCYNTLTFCSLLSTPSCFPLLNGVSAFLRVLSPFVSHCTPFCFPLLDGVYAVPRVLSPLVSHCTPSCLPLLDCVSAFPRVYPFLFPFVPFVGWCVRLPEGLVSSCLPLSPFVSPCLPLPPFLFHKQCTVRGS